MEQSQESKQKEQPEKSKMPDIYVGLFKGQWTVAAAPDIFGESFFNKEDAIAEARRKVEDQRQSGVADIKVYNEETQKFDLLF